ncbi:uncharacterized protein SCDLUD_003408 [Saccharomycodes ludwigii]|uniref:uncharacterized protein n=1 Tax=Saccharomycodes ludwigii TaxID=36035 RepID=UPI001E89F7D6|nr:hypothetical protein SCDLUD_003408 [Saccharomycodes ludwigii]KAH3900428.1 hypothetical protein SCDLUD_003408 [Saccharomycodes ludwigii]
MVTNATFISKHSLFTSALYSESSALDDNTMIIPSDSLVIDVSIDTHTSTGISLTTGTKNAYNTTASTEFSVKSVIQNTILPSDSLLGTLLISNNPTNTTSSSFSSRVETNNVYYVTQTTTTIKNSTSTSTISSLPSINKSSTVSTSTSSVVTGNVDGGFNDEQDSTSSNSGSSSTIKASSKNNAFNYMYGNGNIGFIFMTFSSLMVFL